MKIVNATCYFTEDLERLWERTQVAVDQCVQWWQTSPDAPKWGLYNNDKKLPETLRVGYYSAGSTDCAANLRGWSYWGKKDPRMGIVKKGVLMHSPLHALATAALDYNYMPPEAVRSIARVYCQLLNRSYQFDNEKCQKLFWSWLDDFKIRYRERAKRGSRKAVRKVREEATLLALEKDRENIERTIEDLHRQIAWREADLKLKRQEIRNQKDLIAKI